MIQYLLSVKENLEVTTAVMSNFSQITTREIPDKKYFNKSILVRLRSSNAPSVDIESKTKLAILEYPTYILDALGSWLGFSFIGCTVPTRFCDSLGNKRLNHNKAFTEF